jgi:hypothetical protein
MNLIKGMKKMNTIMIFIFFVISILGNCSGGKTNISPSDTQQRLSRRGDSDRETEIIENNSSFSSSRPDWLKNQEDDFLYLHKYGVISSDDGYLKIIDSLSKEILTSFSESLEITVLHETYKRVSENNADLEEYYNSVTSTFSSATFFGDEFDISVFPDETNCQLGDTVWVDGRLDQQQYQTRFESQFSKNQEEAERHLVNSIQAYEDKDIEYSLFELSRCKYYIDRGGGGVIVENARLKNGSDKSINSQFKEFLIELTEQISYEFITSDHDRKFVFTSKSDQTISAELTLPGDNYNLQGIKMSLLDVEENVEIESIASTNKKGQFTFDLTSFDLENIPKRVVILPKLELEGRENDSYWYSSPSFKAYREAFQSSYFELIYEAFPKQDILIAVGVSEDLAKSTKSTMDFHTQLKSSVLKESQYFNLLEQGTGMSHSDLVKILKNKPKLDNLQKSMLGVTDLIFYATISKAESGVFSAGLTMYSVNKSGLVILGYTQKTYLINNYDYTEGIDQIFKQFMNEYFYRTIQLNLSKGIDFNIKVNEKSVLGHRVDNQLSIRDLSRYHSYSVLLQNDLYRPVNLKIPAEEFYFASSNIPHDQNSGPSFIQDLTITRKTGTLNIKVIDGKTDLPFDNYWNTEINLWQSRYLFGKKNEQTAYHSDHNFIVENLGMYQVSVNHDGYSPSLPHFITIYDNQEYGLFQELQIELNEKSKLIGLGISTLAPGGGHYYFDKPILQSIVPALVYSGTVYLAVTYYQQYLQDRSEFQQHQKLYFDALSYDVSSYHSIAADQSWEDMKSSKQKFALSLASAVVTNILTSGLLYIQELSGY